jgi:hypothetical protein
MYCFLSLSSDAVLRNWSNGRGKEPEVYSRRDGAITCGRRFIVSDPACIVFHGHSRLFVGTLRSKDKVRIIALYILFRDGVPDEDRKRLFQHARLSISEQDAVNNLVYLGCKIVRVSVSSFFRTHIPAAKGNLRVDPH